ncbi:MAG TPA: DNA mismatch repair protein MutS [Smithella sp.]|nr:DNA mismatch repair protein MutS [Smithella sp.]HQG65027.1 DNA mismatch repair protein MutS [Smithella sp.]HQH16084.1 DNA mismatch repair protein MutS [Smithella sp.]HQI73104.1 DNA mismatch repair protein MutS [Smithella sp.]
MAVGATLDLTPAMKQYVKIKESHPDCILLYRMGDFYEMFFEDAVTAAPVLEITLTSRNKGKEDSVPLCGFPYHAASAYITKLVEKGFKVAICEQVEDPKKAKGIVKREVIRVITPGLVLDEENLAAGENNYLACLCAGRNMLGLAFLDISTGEFQISEFSDRDFFFTAIAGLDFKELLLPSDFPDKILLKTLLMQMPELRMNILDDGYFQSANAEAMLDQNFSAEALTRSRIKEFPALLKAAGAILNYVNQTQKIKPRHVNEIKWYSTDHHLLLDDTARRNLEIFATIQGSSRAGSLFSLFQETLTPMGTRRLRWWMNYPLVDVEKIKARLAAVAEFKNDHILRANLRKILARIYDLERLAGRVSLRVANPRDLVALKISLLAIPELKSMLADCTAPAVASIRSRLLEMSAVVELIGRALIEDPPPKIQDGGFMAIGYDEELDQLRFISRDGKQWIASLEAEERKKTGIHSLKIGFNSVFGYYIEVTKANAELVPDSYIRKQTLVNAERYINQELKEFEQTVLNAEEKIRAREQDLFLALRENLDQYITDIQSNAGLIADLDALTALAEVAEKYHFVCPEINDDDTIDIRDGRHPVVETALKNEGFVPNDCLLDLQDNKLLVITGPNMAGKSTYIRQVALIVLLAQMGSFVPAAGAKIGVVDKIFTRVGASDSLIKGQSTFMVEMTETAEILKNATSRSLVIIDEVGRGTSTFDGLSIAWAIAEYIHDFQGRGIRSLFATHYHQLIDLAVTKNGAKNYNIAVKEWGEKIIFLHKIVEGGTSRSYGIEVARIAGVPKEVITRAREILRNLEKGEFDEIGMPRIARGIRDVKNTSPQLSLFTRRESAMARENKEQEIINELKSIDIQSMSPLEALNKLSELQNKIPE